MYNKFFVVWLVGFISAILTLRTCATKCDPMDWLHRTFIVCVDISYLSDTDLFACKFYNTYNFFFIYVLFIENMNNGSITCNKRQHWSGAFVISVSYHSLHLVQHNSDYLFHSDGNENIFPIAQINAASDNCVFRSFPAGKRPQAGCT